MIDLFNKKIFNAENPFLKRIFNKQFDAYFFLNFPPTKEFDGINSHNIPCWFLNNIKQRIIQVSNIDNSRVFQFIFQQNWQRQDFIREFNSQIGDNRFLFWNSEKDNWAMITDSKSEIAVIGIDWQIADQIKLFYKEFLISPLTAIERLKLADFEDVFYDNYKPSNTLLLGNENNLIWEKYFFECHIDNENDKLFYWKQLEQLYFTISSILKMFKSVDMYADQAFWRQYYMNKQWYTTGKNAPVGGWQVFSHKNCQKVATKFLTNNEHLVLQFEGKHDEADKLIRESKNGLIGFSNFWIYANIEKQAQKGNSADFYFRIIGFRGKTDEINQRFELCFRKDLIEQEKVSHMIVELSRIGFAKRIYRTIRPKTFAFYTKDKPLEIFGMYGLILDTSNNLLFECFDENK